MLILNDIHLCEDSDNVNAIFRTGLQAMYMILVDNLMPMCTC